MRIIYCSTLIFLYVAFYSDVVRGNDPLECYYKHRHRSWTKITYIKHDRVKELEERKDWQNMDLLFKLYCHDQIATVSYEKHVLDKFKVKSCNLKDFESAILLPKLPDNTAAKDERELPTSVDVLYLKNGRWCYKTQYHFRNWMDDGKDAGEITKIGPTKSRCSKEAGLDIRDGQNKHVELDVFGSCKAGSFLYGNVHGVRSFDDEWAPASLSLDPPGIKTDKETPHTKLLYCTYKTDEYLFKLLCIKFPGRANYAAYVGEDTKTVDMDRFNVTSCQEDHIVNSIFPPNYSTKKPGPGPTHVIKYAYFTGGRCLERSYNCPLLKKVVGTQAKPTTCPSLADIAPVTRTIGQWENCVGPLKSPDIIDLTVD